MVFASSAEVVAQTDAEGPQVVVPAGEAAGDPGVRRIPVSTPKGTFEVWTRKLGSNPKVKVLVVHGGPTATHWSLEPLARLAEAGFEVYFYDQLGGGLSDVPEEPLRSPELWTLPRWVDEVEQVRRALEIEPDELYLFGHSWGAVVAIEHALAHPGRAAGLILSNMMASMPAYADYLETEILPAMEPAAREEIERLVSAGEFTNPRLFELMVTQFYEPFFVRLPVAEWPEGLNRAFTGVNPEIQGVVHGPDILHPSGTGATWDRTADLARIEVPTLVIGATHDAMDPKHLEWMAGQLPRGRYHHCPESAHLPMWDDPERYFEGLNRFLKDAEAGRLQD
jgi:proline iminopeptidase